MTSSGRHGRRGRGEEGRDLAGLGDGARPGSSSRRPRCSRRSGPPPVRTATVGRGRGRGLCSSSGHRETATWAPRNGDEPPHGVVSSGLEGRELPRHHQLLGEQQHRWCGGAARRRGEAADRLLDPCGTARPICTGAPGQGEVVLGRTAGELDRPPDLRSRTRRRSSSSVVVLGRSGTGTAGSAAYAVHTNVVRAGVGAADRDDQVGRLVAEQRVEVEQGDLAPLRHDGAGDPVRAVDSDDGAPGDRDDLAVAEQLQPEPAFGRELLAVPRRGTSSSPSGRAAGR